MQTYESKQHQIPHSAEQIYTLISRFDNLTPAVDNRVEQWQADADTCSFKAKGFTVRLRITERDELKHVKIEGDGIPMDFSFWIQLNSVSELDTRIRLVLHIELNTMMKMMIGNKLQDAVDQIADGIARAFTLAPKA